MLDGYLYVIIVSSNTTGCPVSKKKIWGLLLADSHFIEERRKSLRRWLTLVARHPAVSGDPLLSFFLTYSGADVQHKIREIFRRVPDEFTTSELAARAKVCTVAYVV